MRQLHLLYMLVYNRYVLLALLWGQGQDPPVPHRTQGGTKSHRQPPVARGVRYSVLQRGEDWSVHGVVSTHLSADTL